MLRALGSSALSSTLRGSLGSVLRRGFLSARGIPTNLASLRSHFTRSITQAKPSRGNVPNTNTASGNMSNEGMDISLQDKELLKLLQTIDAMAPYIVKKGKNSVVDILRTQLSLLCEDLADYTPPMAGAGEGHTTAAKRRGEDRVRKDIEKVYKPAKSTENSKLPLLILAERAILSNSPMREFAARAGEVKNPAIRRIANAALKGDQTARKNFIQIMRKRIQANVRWGMNDKRLGIKTTVEMFDGGTAHKAARQANQGRVSKRKTDTLYIQKGYAQVKAYIRKRQENVGFMKAGWNQAAKQIQPTRRPNFPAWVKRHKAVLGRAMDDSPSASVPSILSNGSCTIHLAIINDIGNMYGIAVKKNTIVDAIVRRRRNFETHLRHSLKKNIAAMVTLNRIP